MAAIFDPETVDGLGGPFGWWHHTENLYKLVQAFSPHLLWYGLGRPVITPEIGSWSVLVLFGWLLVFGIIMK